jgi:hypothetical protein
VERGKFANFLYLALNPVFVSRVADGLELDADRIELTEQRGMTDPTLRHIALAYKRRIRTQKVKLQLSNREIVNEHVGYQEGFI